MKENSREEDIKMIEILKNKNLYINIKPKSSICIDCINKNKNKHIEAEVVINEKLEEAINYILSDYKRVLKENEELKENCNIDYKRECEVLALQLHLLREEAKTTEEDYNMLKEYYKEQNEVNARFISVQRIKDIIDRIDYDIKKTKEIISKNTNIYASYRKNDYQIVRLRAMNTKSLDIKKRLQKLLESEE